MTYDVVIMKTLELEILSSLWTATWQSAVLIAAVVILRRILRGRLSARWRFALWGVVALRLVLPVLPSSPLGVLPANAVPSDGAWLLAKDAAAPAAPLVESAPLEVTPSNEAVALMEPAPLSRPSRTAWPTVVLSAWLAGVVVSLLLFSRGILSQRRRIRHGRLTGETAWESEVVKACADLGVRPPRIVVMSGKGSPAVAGFWRPTLVLPQDTMRSLSQGERLEVLRHEASHLAGRDHWTEGLRALLQCFYWFHPLFWLANHLVVADREEACDERVLAHTNSNPESYGGALLAVLRLGVQQPLAGGLGVLDSCLTRRVKSICGFREIGRVHHVAAMLLITLFGVFGLTKEDGLDAVEPPEKANTEMDDLRLLMKETRVDEISLREAPMGEALDALNQIAAASGVSFEAVGEFEREPSFSLTLRRTDLDTLVEFFCDINNMALDARAGNRAVFVPKTIHDPDQKMDLLRRWNMDLTSRDTKSGKRHQWTYKTPEGPVYTVTADKLEVRRKTFDRNVIYYISFNGDVRIAGHVTGKGARMVYSSHNESFVLAGHFFKDGMAFLGNRDERSLGNELSYHLRDGRIYGSEEMRVRIETAEESGK